MSTATDHAEARQRLLARLELLPDLPEPARRLITSGPSLQEEELTLLVADDPILTAGLRRRIGRDQGPPGSEEDLAREAMRRVGVEGLGRIALARQLVVLFQGSGSELGQWRAGQTSELWRHGLAVGCAAAGLVEGREGGPGADEAFVLGLLHDVGKPAIELLAPRSFARILRRSESARGDIAELERSTFGLDHTGVGHRLASRWRLPPSVCEAIWLHHHDEATLPREVGAGGHVQIVQLADAMAREAGIGRSGNHRVARELPELAGRLGLSEGRRREVADRLAAEVASLEEWLGLDGGEPWIDAARVASMHRSLREEARRGRRSALCLEAIDGLQRALGGSATMGQVCMAGAEAARRALDLPFAALAGQEGGYWRWIGVASSGSEPALIIPLRPLRVATGRTAAARTNRAMGQHMLPAAPEDRALIDALGEPFLSGECWLLPIVEGEEWVAVGVLPTSRRWEEAGAVLSPLFAALSRAVSSSRHLERQMTLAEGLAEDARKREAGGAERVRAEAMSSLAAMAAGAAHELNNPLAVISGRAQFLATHLPEGAERSALRAIADKAVECSGIVSDLIEFAAPPKPAPRNVDVLECVEEAVRELVRKNLASENRVTMEGPSDRPTAWFDPALLRRVFLELLSNAAEATIREDPQIAVKAARDLTEESVVVTVTDNGRGMTPEVLARAMDPFFSWRPAGRGRGMGLARVARWLQSGGGVIGIESRVGEGTRVEVRLPRGG